MPKLDLTNAEFCESRCKKVKFIQTRPEPKTKAKRPSKSVSGRHPIGRNRPGNIYGCSPPCVHFDLWFLTFFPKKENLLERYAKWASERARKESMQKWRKKSRAILKPTFSETLIDPKANFLPLLPPSDPKVSLNSKPSSRCGTSLIIFSKKKFASILRLRERGGWIPGSNWTLSIFSLHW